jgi:hypothetical protein
MSYITQNGESRTTVNVRLGGAMKAAIECAVNRLWRKQEHSDAIRRCYRGVREA